MSAILKKSSGYLHLLVKTAVVLLFLVVFVGTVALILLSRGVQAPDWAKTWIQTLVNDTIENGQVRFIGMELALAKGNLNPNLTVSGIEILDSDGNLQLVLPAIRTQLSRSELLRGRIRPIKIRMVNADLRLVRDENGRIDLSLGEPQASQSAAPVRGSGELMSVLDNIFALPVLSRVQIIESLGATVSLRDARTGRHWVFSDSRIVVTNGADEIGATVAFKLKSKSTQDANALLSWRQPKSGEPAEFSATFSGFSTQDIADQIPALQALRQLNAPISGSVTVNVGADGTLGDVSGVIDVGEGVLAQAGEATPIQFRGAKAYVTYDSALQKLSLDEVTIDTDAVKIVTEGQAYLSDRIDQTSGAVIAQVRLKSATLNPDGLFAAPVILDQGALDLRVQFDPLRVDVGQLVLAGSGSKFVASGVISGSDAGLAASIDLTLDQISMAQLLQYWPLTLKERTRDWFAENINAGQISNLVGAVRVIAGETPEINIGFDLSDVNVRYIKALPVIENGRGYGVLTHKDMRLVLDEGSIQIPNAGPIDLAGSTMFIPEIRMREAPAHIALKTRSSIRAAMGLLDMPPFEFMTRAGVDLDLAQGIAVTSGTINLPLAKRVTFDQVDFAISGILTKVRSDKLVKDKIIRAGELTLVANNDGVSISGPAILGKTPLSGTWSQKFGPGHKGHSRFDGAIELSQRFLDEFSVTLPKGSVAGVGSARVEIELEKGKPPSFQLVSDLNRLQLALGAVGWSKPKNVTGRLDVRGLMTTPMTINRLNLATRGLDVSGKIILKADGSLEVAQFKSVKLDGWLNARVEFRPNGKNSLLISVMGGQADFRKSKFANTQSSSQVNHVKINLDRLVLSRGIALTNVSGNLATGNGISGSFEALVNGGARIVGTLAQQSNGVGVRFTSENAGAVLRSTGIFDTAVGGRLDMVLLPAQARGHYDGVMNITKTRVVNAPSLAELLSAISVVGLLEQLGSGGILFSNIDAKFRMSPTDINLTSGSAVGVSMGITMTGRYDFEASRMNMEGVITPIYVLNGLLEQSKLFGGLFGKKKGEGLIGFNYKLKGPVASPSVSVNPLSLLTPGIFRDIFKQPVPEPAQ